MTRPIRELVRFHGGHGPLNGELAYPDDRDPEFAALIAGPHPYMGGTMCNRLVETLAETLTNSGGVTLRFDYAGAGASAGPKIDVAASMAEFWKTGHAPEDNDRIGDAISAARCLRNLNIKPVVLVGYSFGAYAVWRVGRENLTSVDAMILVSPTISRHAFTWPDSDFAVCPPTLVIHSESDFATPAFEVANWAACNPHAVRRVWLLRGDHFFRGQETQVVSLALEFIQTMAPCVCAGAAL